MADGKRTRRSPEESRALILEAARVVLSELGPDKAGLKDVAKEAGVSHGLVTHYFGTFDALVEQTLQAHVLEVRGRLLTRLASGEAIEPARAIRDFFEIVDDPLYGRLVAWAILSGRMEDADFFSRRDKGPARVADAIETWTTATGRPPIDRDELEAILLLIITSALGYAVGREVLWASLEKEATAERDDRFRSLVGELLARRLDGSEE